jgi:hypothetical protein
MKTNSKIKRKGEECAKIKQEKKRKKETINKKRKQHLFLCFGRKKNLSGLNDGGWSSESG